MHDERAHALPVATANGSSIIIRIFYIFRVIFFCSVIPVIHINRSSLTSINAVDVEFGIVLCLQFDVLEVKYFVEHDDMHFAVNVNRLARDVLFNTVPGGSALLAQFLPLVVNACQGNAICLPLFRHHFLLLGIP